MHIFLEQCASRLCAYLDGGGEGKTRNAYGEGGRGVGEERKGGKEERKEKKCEQCECPASL